MVHGMIDLFSVAEVAEYMKTSKQQVRKMIASGELEAIMVGREYRITLAALASWLDNQKD